MLELRNDSFWLDFDFSLKRFVLDVKFLAVRFTLGGKFLVVVYINYLVSLNADPNSWAEDSPILVD